jgi:translation elongation factor EF-4
MKENNEKLYCTNPSVVQHINITDTMIRSIENPELSMQVGKYFENSNQEIDNITMINLAEFITRINKMCGGFVYAEDFIFE